MKSRGHVLERPKSKEFKDLPKLVPPELPSSIAELRNALRQLNNAYVSHKKHRSNERVHSSPRNVEAFVNLTHGPPHRKNQFRQGCDKHVKLGDKDHRTAHSLRRHWSKDTESVRTAKLVDCESMMSAGSMRSRLSSWVFKLVPNRMRRKTNDVAISSQSEVQQFIQNNSDQKAISADLKSHQIDKATLESKNPYNSFGKSTIPVTKVYGSQTAWNMQAIEPGENENFGKSKRPKDLKGAKLKEDIQLSFESGENMKPKPDEIEKYKKKQKKHRKHQNDTSIPMEQNVSDADNRDVRQIPMIELHSFRTQPIDQEAMLQNTELNSSQMKHLSESNNENPDIPAESNRHKKKASKRPKPTDTEVDLETGDLDNEHQRSRSKKHRTDATLESEGQQEEEEYREKRKQKHRKSLGKRDNGDRDRSESDLENIQRSRKSRRSHQARDYNDEDMTMEHQ
ncbi:unnamed protein product, partial [Echinostoma caproni]|uniref:PINc domain-containing protein n=1 Tax=Echinostoma caproni TaxID=27848 RepID=A0A183AB51_9TREM